MPAKGMSTDELVVGLGEADKGIATAVAELTAARLGGIPGQVSISIDVNTSINCTISSNSPE